VDTGPDFICIGSSRCGTTFIYKHLREHSDIWMPPVKEIHFFNEQCDKPIWNQWTKLFYKYMIRQAVISLFTPSRKTMLDWIFSVKYLTGKRNHNWYKSLFYKPDGMISGDITPSYCKMDEEELRELFEMFPDTKIILMMRNPVDRLWSLATKIFGRKRNRNVSEASVDEIIAELYREPVQNMTDYMAIINRVEKIFPKQNIFYGFLDEIKFCPYDFLTKLYNFLDVQVPELSLDVEVPVNDTKAYSANPPAKIHAMLCDTYLPMTKDMEKRFGEIPRGWRIKMESSLGIK